MAQTPKPSTPKKAGRADLVSLLGIGVALAGILGGLVLEGGSLKDVRQITAALIVLAGTAGAVMVSTPGSTLKSALRQVAGVFHDKSPKIEILIDEVIGYATKARKTGIVSLEDATEAVADPFLKKALTLAVDGTDLQEIRSMLELDLQLAEQHAEAGAKVFESAGGYAPTVGIIGAVLGLIQVMKNLANIDEVGHGIAVAFVATVYGVGLANLVLLPVASKIKARAHAETRRKEFIIEGVGGIVEGLNPKLLRVKLESYLHAAPAKEKKAERRAAPATETVKA